jgi:uncharacterized protein (TIGR03435 family)
MNRRQLFMAGAGSFLLKGQEFEAASIKPSAPVAMGMMKVGMSMMPGGRIAMSGITVRLLIQQAYGVRDFQIVGGPDWMRSERYDITAKPAEAASEDQVKLMIRGLLKDRFQLVFHRETKELPTYALVVAKGGPKLKIAEVMAAGGEGGSGGGGRGGQIRIMGRGRFDASGVPVSALANHLSQVLGRSVIDKTELTGDYDFKLEWTPDERQGGMMKGPGGESAAPSDNPGASIFTALQEFGLKLESTKGPVDIFVIERAEKASEN